MKRYTQRCLEALQARRSTINQFARQAAPIAMFAVVASVHPTFADALTPVTGAATILRDTIVGICLLVMTGAWGYAGMQMAFSGATVRGMSGPFIGGAIAGGAAAMAAAFIGGGTP